ncbi:MAG: hypothetical protein QOG83_196 [Alphaproteobacteria bacterium]|nr:hypothetical protein [Alphaproteobacteria bacterium]
MLTHPAKSRTGARPTAWLVAAALLVFAPVAAAQGQAPAAPDAAQGQRTGGQNQNQVNQNQVNQNQVNQNQNQGNVKAEFRTALEPHGRWQNHSRWGEVWIPSNRQRDWKPYTVGHWVYTEDYGWYWIEDDAEAAWGVVAFHYGRWAYDEELLWVWIPGEEWGPGWVNWRRGKDVIGWAAMPPDEVVVEVIEKPDVWVFVRTRDFTAPRIAVVVLPPREYTVFFHETVVENRTVVLRERRFAVNPGIPPAIIAAAIGRPLRAYQVRPRVLAGTVQLQGAEVVRPEDLRGGRGSAVRVTARETQTVIRPASRVPDPQPLAAGEPGRLGDNPPRAARGEGQPTTGQGPVGGTPRQQGQGPSQQPPQGQGKQDPAKGARQKQDQKQQQGQGRDNQGQGQPGTTGRGTDEQRPQGQAPRQGQGKQDQGKQDPAKGAKQKQDQKQQQGQGQQGTTGRGTDEQRPQGQAPRQGQGKQDPGKQDSGKQDSGKGAKQQQKQAPKQPAQTEGRGNQQKQQPTQSEDRRSQPKQPAQTEGRGVQPKQPQTEGRGVQPKQQQPQTEGRGGGQPKQPMQTEGRGGGQQPKQLPQTEGRGGGQPKQPAPGAQPEPR